MSNPFGGDDDDVQPLPPALLLGPNPFSFDSNREDSPPPATPTHLIAVSRTAPEATPEPDWLRDAATILDADASESPWASPHAPNGHAASRALVVLSETPPPNPFGPVSPGGLVRQPLVVADPASPMGPPRHVPSLAAWMVEPTDDAPPSNSTALVVPTPDSSSELAAANPFGLSPTSHARLHPPAAPEPEPEPEPPAPPPPPPKLRTAQSRIDVRPATFADDMAAGMEALLESGRHADLLFVAGGATLYSHRAVLEARCGARLTRYIYVYMYIIYIYIDI